MLMEEEARIKSQEYIVNELGNYIFKSKGETKGTYTQLDLLVPEIYLICSVSQTVLY